MNIQDFSKRWALHYINPDFMKIPMSSTTVFQGSGFYLNFILKNSPHPQAKWCVTTFYIRNTVTDEYIYFGPIEENEVFSMGIPDLNKIPNAIKKNIDTNFLVGFETKGKISQVLADKYYHGPFEIQPSIYQALHSFYIELPPGRYEYIEYACYGGYINRKEIILISNPQLEPVLVNIPHEAIYQEYQLDTGWKEFSDAIDCEDTSFEKYEDDPLAVFTTSQSITSRILNDDYYYEETQYLTGFEGTMKAKKILEKTYNFQTKKINSDFQDFEYSLNPTKATNITIRSEQKSSDSFTPYEYSICNWRYEGEQEIDTSYSGGRFGGGRWDEENEVWEYSSIVLEFTKENSLNVPSNKKYVLEEVLYEVPVNYKRLTYPIKFSYNGSNVTTNIISNGIAKAIQEYQSTSSSRHSFYTWNEGNTSNILSRDSDEEEEQEAYRYYYSYFPSYVDKTKIEEYKDYTYSSHFMEDMQYYESISVFNLDNSNNDFYISYSTEWYLNCAAPFYPKRLIEKQIEKVDNNLDEISYSFSPVGTRFYFYDHETPGLYLLDNFEQLDDEQFYYSSDVYMDPPSLSLIGNSAPSLHVKDSFSSAQGTIVIDQTLYSYNWKPVSLDKIWRSEIFSEGHGFNKYEHYVPTADGYSEKKLEWDTFTSFSSGNNQSNNQQNHNFYFETSQEAIHDEHWTRENTTSYIQTDNFHYATKKYTPSVNRGKGIVIYKGRHWGAMVSKLLPADGWSTAGSNARYHHLFAVNLTRDSNVAQTFQLYMGQRYESNYDYTQDFLEGEYYWNCLTLIGMIDSIYKYYSEQEFLEDTSQWQEPVHYETQDSIFFYTACANELSLDLSRKNITKSSIRHYLYTIPWILTPEYYDGHDLSKTKEFKGFIFFGEKLKNKPKIKARHT